MFRLIHGDCVQALRDMPGESVDLILTDPPYGIDYQSGAIKQKEFRMAKIANDDAPFIWHLRDSYRVLKDGGRMLTFSRWDVNEAFAFAARIAGFTVVQYLVWDKASGGMGDLKGTFSPSYESIIYAVKGRYSFDGGRPRDVITIPKLPSNVMEHPNQKPVPLMEHLICAVTRPGEVVLDPFMGSGTTGLAAVNCDREYIGMEIDDKYYELAKQRITAASNQTRMKLFEAGGGKQIAAARLNGLAFLWENGFKTSILRRFHGRGRGNTRMRRQKRLRMACRNGL